jgi:signal peptidase II (EC:3.4.23.36). Aspartic peptidase. MEROPS family A08
MRARFRFGLLLAALVLAADQLSKWWILQIVELDRVGQIVVTPFLNLTMVWNRGITFGLLGSDLWWKPLLLGALALAIAGLLVRWLARAESGRVAWGLGLVLGGAVGNVIDRARFGACRFHPPARRRLSLVCVQRGRQCDRLRGRPAAAGCLDPAATGG